MNMNRIQELRKEKNWRQEDLAARLSITRQAVANHEAGRRDLSSGMIEQLCGVFECTADYLLGLSEVRKYAFTVQEYAIIAAYRAADEDDRAVVDHALKKYMKKEKPAERA